MQDDIRVEVKSLIPTPTGSGIFLGNTDKTIAIFVDHSVGAAITMFMHGIKKPRPLTHDLIGNILAGLGTRLEKVVINDLEEETFFARLYLVQENELGKNIVEVDARPSDAVAMAFQQEAPVWVAKHVWSEAADMTELLAQAQAEHNDSPEDD